MRSFWRRWGKVILIALGLVTAYFITRLINLTKLPIFTDEAIYIRWSQIGERDANWRFISLTDGKQPLFTWIMMVFLRLLPTDPLFSGRLVSVLAGLGTLVGLWFLAYELFKSRRIAILASFLYLISPFGLVYDRMALYDSLVAAFYVWNLYLGILLARYQRLDAALILGLTLGAGMLNKSSGFLSLYLLPTTILVFSWRKVNRLKQLARWVGLLLVSAVLSQLVYSVLRLSPLLHMVTQKDALFVYSFHEWLSHPWQFFIGNFKGLSDWLVRYLSKPLLVVSLLPLVFFWRQGRAKALLYLWWLAPFIALALFGRVLYPRFILFMAMPLLILAAIPLAWLLGRWGRKVFCWIILLVIVWPSLYTDYFVIANPLYAPIPYADRGQYIDSWPSGWGIKEVNQYLGEQAKHGKAAVYTEGTFGLLPAAIEIYLVDNPNLKIRGIWPLPQDPPAEILKDAAEIPTFLVLSQTQELPAGWPLKLIAAYQKGTHPTRKLRFLQVVPGPARKL